MSAPGPTAAPTAPINDERAEAALLGCVLVEQDVLNFIAPILTVDDFYHEPHRAIFAAALAVHKDGADVDAVTVATELQRVGKWEQVGAAPYLDTCIDAAPLVAHPEEYARRIAHCARRRNIARAAERLAKAAADGAVPTDTVAVALDALHRRGEELARTDEEPPIVRWDAVTADSDEPDWLVPGVWPAEGAGFLAGEPKVSKSMLALDLAAAVASGGKFLGRPVAKSGRVLVVAAEDKPSEVARRLRRLHGGRGLTEPAPVHLWDRLGLNLDDRADRDLLRRAVLELRPRLLVLDPLRRVTGVEENDSAAVGELLGWIRTLQREATCAVAVVHHLRKPGRDGGTGDERIATRLRGSGELFGWGDCYMFVEPGRDGLRRVSWEMRYALAPEPVTFRLTDPLRDDGGADLRVEVVTQKDADQAIRVRIWDAIGAGSLNGGALDRAVGGKAEHVRRVRDAMVEAGQLVVVDGPRPREKLYERAAGVVRPGPGTDPGRTIEVPSCEEGPDLVRPSVPPPRGGRTDGPGSRGEGVGVFGPSRNGDGRPQPGVN